MNIILLGATGKTGKEVLSQALAAGFSVTVVVRTPGKLGLEHKNLHIIEGDATDTVVLSKALSKSGVLISTLGSMNDSSLITHASHAIVSAGKRFGLQRVIMLSSFAVNRGKLTAIMRIITGIMLKKIVADKQAGETVLRSSGLEWTIVYATTLTNGLKTKTARIVPASEQTGLFHKISRADVASWLLHEAISRDYLNTDVTITGR